MIHFPFQGNKNMRENIIVINRFSVPFFFFVSGFFLLDNKNNITLKRIKYKIKHIITLIYYSVRFHIIYCFIYNNIRFKTKWNYGKYFISIFTMKKIFRFFITNNPFIYAHLWFLFALLYCYLFILILIIKNKNLIKNISFELFIIGFGIIGYIFLAEFSGYKLLKLEKYFCIQNIFLFRSISYVFLGIFIKVSNIKSNKNICDLIHNFIIGALIACIERKIMDVYIFTYFGTYIQVISLILISTFKIQINNGGIIAYIGRELSGKIYIYHIAIGRFILLINKNFNFLGNFKFIIPLIIIFYVILFSFITKIIKEKCCL